MSTAHITEDERRAVERGERWESFCKYMPKLTIPEGCQIQVIPPFCGAIVRFVVHKGNRSVSVYFDAYSRLGYCEGEYWEAYPIDDNNNRYAPTDHDMMMADIARELSKP